MRRSYRFRLRPTAKQHIALLAMLEGHRELYNAALEERRAAYRWGGVGCRSGMAISPPSGGWPARKSGLNRGILDAGWGQFLTILGGKAESAGRTVIAVNPRYTSITCYRCGHRDKGNRVGEAFGCLVCGHTDHADRNAARNQLRDGLSQREGLAAWAEEATCFGGWSCHW